MAATLSGERLRAAGRLANANALLWAIGAGLAPTLLVSYLAMSLGAQGLGLSAVIAAPRFAGVLRLATPWLIRTFSRKSVCTLGFVSSSAALAMLPVAVSASQAVTPGAGLAILLTCWCAYQVLEFLGATALWSWLGDLYPARIRGRLIGRRESFLTVGRAIGAVGGFAIVSALGRNGPIPLTSASTAGAMFMMLSVIPLWLTPDAAPRSLPATAGKKYGPDLRRLCGWSMLLSLANGVTAAARSLFIYRVLGFHYPAVLLMTVGMRAGQSLLATPVGRQVDRVGPRAVVAAGQAVVVLSPLCFLAASEFGRWWLAGAYVCWAAYAALNVGLDAAKLAASPPGDNAPSLAAYYVANDLASGVAILLGGMVIGPILGQGGAEAHAYYPALLLGLGMRLAVLCLTPLLPGKSRPQA